MIATKAELEVFKNQLLVALPPLPSKRVIESLFQFDLPVSVSEIWPYMIDTSRMNSEMGLPPREEKEVDGENHVSTVTLGKKEAWIEKPWVWVHEKEIQQQRIFQRGWMSEHRGIFRLEERGTNASRVQVYFRWTFPNIFFYALFKIVPKSLEKVFDKFLQNKTKFILQNRVEKTRTGIHQIPDQKPYDMLRNYFLTGDQLDLDRIHAKELSEKFGLPLNDVLQVCVQMVKDGDLTLSWDVICPHCRSARAESKSIAGLTEENSCGPCGTLFGIDQEESIEVVFHISPKLRTIQTFVYCAAEPAKKKHIKLHQAFAPGVSKTYQMRLPAGTYRLRKKESNESIYIDLVAGHSRHEFAWDGSQTERLSCNNEFSFTLTNKGKERDYFTLEEAWWFKDRLLSGEALSHPLIREIFSEDHLQVGLKLNVGNQVILFTDIVGSTPLYKSLGDALSLKAVQSHYKEVSELITKHDGVVVKYIGDAVMAAFLDLEKAMKCTVEIHQKFSADRKDTPIRLRASFHEGKVLCANMNVGLDYFGNTVNQAAKIQKYANAHEIAVTEEDWKRLSHQFTNLQVKPVIHDPKLNIDIRIVTVS